MKRSFLRSAIVGVLSAFLFPVVAFAHQPRLATTNPVIVTDPEISKAYYGVFSGEPIVYTISSDVAFQLYVNVLVPDVQGQKKDISAVVIKKGVSDEVIATLDGTTYEWKKFFEPFGRDSYWQGPEYRNQVEPGNYEIRVSGPVNTSRTSMPDNVRKYSLAIGEIEKFDIAETINALRLIPQIKRDWFGTSPSSFALSVFGVGYILVMFAVAFVCGFTYRAVARKFAPPSKPRPYKNINLFGRILRGVLSLVLFILAITTSWSALLLFFAGFCFFEAIFSWCGFFALIGKNTCPIQ